MRAIDVSNYTGDLSDAQLAALKAEGIELVVVRLSLETPEKRSVAKRQLQACTAAGLRVSGYLWCYWDQDPGSTVIDALALVKEARTPIEMLWLDAEEPPAGHLPDEIISWLRAAINMAILGANQATGLYTSAWWWVQNTANSDRCSDVPLWTALYDNVPDVGVWQPYGGWTRLTGKQYQGDTTVAGIPSVDLNVFDFDSIG